MTNWIILLWSCITFCITYFQSINTMSVQTPDPCSWWSQAVSTSEVFSRLFLSVCSRPRLWWSVSFPVQGHFSGLNLTLPGRTFPLQLLLMSGECQSRRQLRWLHDTKSYGIREGQNIMSCIMYYWQPCKIHVAPKISYVTPWRSYVNPEIFKGDS